MGGVHQSHAAAAELALDDVTPHGRGRWEPLRDELPSRFGEKVPGLLIGDKKGLHLLAQLAVSGACLVEEIRPGALVLLEHEHCQLLDLPEAFGRHSGFSSPSSRYSQALAQRHSRLIVLEESSRSWAVSSTLRPPKYRSSTICAFRGSRAARRLSASSTATTSAVLCSGIWSASLSETLTGLPPRLA